MSISPIECESARRPPRVIHIKTGNLKFAQLNEKLGACWPNIEPRLSQCRLVNVYLDRIETVS